MTPMTSMDAVLAAIFERAGAALVLGAPLGLGKPHRLLNALYGAVASDPSKSLRIFTALSLTPPALGQGLQRRFLEPFLQRHFGADFQALDYSLAQQRDALPANVEVCEFYLQSGLMLGSEQAQQSYSSLNYTHVARAVAQAGVNVFVQKVSREPGGTRLSLSCNPDLTADLLDEISRVERPRPLMVAEVDPDLPWIGGSACVAADFFDIVLDLPGPAPKLFALPRQSVSDAEYSIALHASALIHDGGTLQIGIGSLSDALCHCLVLRHSSNAQYRALLDALAPGFADCALVQSQGGVGPFSKGLYGASEMVNDGFMRLAQAGILVRRVLDDLPAMQRIEAGKPSEQDIERLDREGRWLDGAFYLGSRDLYDWLRDMPADLASGIGMTRVSHINELYGGNESLERVQRRDSRFFNTCMMTTVLGAAVSDGLADGRVVSGVGGQYNFVAMAHALHDARSMLVFRATREAHGRVESNVVYNYGHVTIPRHLRDISITEYGIADLRGASDSKCIMRMLALCDARFRPALERAAKQAGKLADTFVAPPGWAENHPARLRATLRPHRLSGLLPDYPLGSDFTPVEQRIARALAWLKAATASRRGKLATLAKALMPAPARDSEAMQRMGLQAPASLRERMDARLLALAVRQTPE